jgi:branched-chain amino acid transport system substrate-binding protein
MTRTPLVVVSVMVMGLMGCTGKSAPEPLPVGHIVSMSGPGEFGGDQARQGILLALEDLNKEDKRGAARPILVQHADGRNGPATATRLIKIDRVAGLLDSTSPAQVLGLASVAATAEMPTLTISPLGRMPPNEFLFSLVASPGYQGQVLARFAREELKVESIVALGDSRIPASSVVLDVFSREFTKNGGRVGPGPGAFESDKDFTDRIGQIEKAKPPAVLFAGTARDLAQVATLLHQSAPSAPILFAGDEAALLALATTPRSEAKVYLCTAFAPEGLTPAGQELAKAYKDRFGQELNVHAALAHDGIRLLTDALHKSRTGGQGVKKELAAVDGFESVTGALSFTKEGCARRSVFVVVVADGKSQMEKKYDAEPQ